MTTDSVESSGGNPGHGIKRFVNRLRASSFRSSTDSDHHDGESNQRKSKNKHLSRDADISLQLWNSAYDALRDDPTTAALVVSYESIISQELPDHLKIGGININFRGKSNTQRLELLTEIAKAGMTKRRGSKISQVDEAARTVSEISKERVASRLAVYPSSAVAWAGICTLTPVSNKQRLFEIICLHKTKRPMANSNLASSGSHLASRSYALWRPPCDRSNCMVHVVIVAVATR